MKKCRALYTTMAALDLAMAIKGRLIELAKLQKQKRLGRQERPGAQSYPAEQGSFGWRDLYKHPCNRLAFKLKDKTHEKAASHNISCCHERANQCRRCQGVARNGNALHDQGNGDK